MPASVTFTFVPGTTADANQVNQNFTDLVTYINGLVIPTVPVSIVNGGTGSNTVQGALTSLGLARISILPCTSAASGTVVTLTQLSNTPVVSAYSLGMTAAFNAPGGGVSGGSITVQIGSLSALSLLDPSGNAITSLIANQYCIISYNASGNNWQLENPIPAGSVQPVPTGSIFWFGANSAPSGYLECDGSSVLRATYPGLFAIVSTTFGSVDGSHFNLPDLRGYFARGWDHSAGVDPGRTFGSTQSYAIQSHLHTVTGTLLGGAGAASGGQLTDSFLSFNSGSTGGSETRPINLALLGCIKT